MEGSEELAPSKRRRIGTLTLAPPSSPIATKGKEKMEDSAVDVDACPPPDATCAICLADGGQSIRGRIDSCEHFFCFICIMEWAKIESRCPACKRRFQSIRRPPLPGLFSCERIVNVQHRDQGSYCYGDQSTELSDPYANVNCTTCQSFADENLLLLCDLCDSAHHTYCVGLGFTVPEGDWYCHDCTMSRAEHTNSQNVPAVETVSPVQNSVPVGRTASSAQEGSDKGARTLHRCRNVHSHIKTLRENWDSLRAGLLVFSSSASCVSDKSCDRHQKGNRVSSDLPTTSNSVRVNSSQVTKDGNISGEEQKKRDLGDVNRAWKMMEIAKTLRGSQRSTISNNLNICHRTNRTGSLQPASFYKSVISSQKAATSSELEHFRHFPLKTLQNRCKPVDYKKQSSCMTTMKEIKQTYIGSENRHLLVNSKLSGTKQSKFSPSYIYDEKEKPALPWPLQKAPTSFSEYNAHTNPCSAAYLHPETSSQTITTVIESSHSEVEKHRWRQDACADTDASIIRKNGSAKISLKDRNVDQSQTRRDDTANNSAKGEVQSLVKLNLKLLSKDLHLGTDKFKEVARTATHSIMAACGLEHRESSRHSYSRSICRHTEQIKQLRKSNLMPDSCRECFFAFVKNVVDSVLLERTSIQSQ